MWVHLLSSAAEPKLLVFTTKATVKVWSDVLSIVLTNLLIKTVCGLWFDQIWLTGNESHSGRHILISNVANFLIGVLKYTMHKMSYLKTKLFSVWQNILCSLQIPFFFVFFFFFEKCSFQSLLNSCSVGKYENECRVVILQSQRPLSKPDNIPSSTWLELLYFFSLGVITLLGATIDQIVPFLSHMPFTAPRATASWH